MERDRAAGHRRKVTTMKSLLPALGLTLLLVTQTRTAFSNVEGISTPTPGYPAVAYAAHITGAGRCQVTFGASGNVVKATMVKSTGAKVLDDNTLAWARAHWTGRPDTRVQVPITYK